MTQIISRDSLARNSHMTFKANMGVGRHGWLRLTPAYSVKLVRDRIDSLAPGSTIIDPFSGTGTTPLAAAELGHEGHSVDVNPFLIWLGNTKMAEYSTETLLEVADAAHNVEGAVKAFDTDTDLWQPKLFKIEKWWSPGALHALKVLRHAIDSYDGQVKDLLELGLCRSLISCSNAAFNHQSMSFKKAGDAPVPFITEDVDRTIAAFEQEMSVLIDSARYALPGTGTVHQGDSRSTSTQLEKADLLLTSPPYANRMSYIRELRPYMYWLRYLDVATDAGDLDWNTIGGTWGTATSKVGKWEPSGATPVDESMIPICESIAADGGKNGPLLANYVKKYHHDMWMHFQSALDLVKPGGAVSYIVGNSTFYGHEVPVHDWYAQMLHALGLRNVRVDVIRKRNSNKKLFEFEVSGDVS